MALLESLGIMDKVGPDDDISTRMVFVSAWSAALLDLARSRILFMYRTLFYCQCVPRLARARPVHIRAPALERLNHHSADLAEERTAERRVHWVRERVREVERDERRARVCVGRGRRWQVWIGGVGSARRDAGRGEVRRVRGRGREAPGSGERLEERRAGERYSLCMRQHVLGHRPEGIIPPQTRTASRSPDLCSSR
jgi:hypothetical protein